MYVLLTHFYIEAFIICICNFYLFNVPRLAELMYVFNEHAKRFHNARARIYFIV